MKPLFVSSVSIVTSAPDGDRHLFVAVLGLPLTGDEDYVFTEGLPGVKHFGVWPLAQAAQSCFGTETWPPDRPVPQASIEFDVEDVTAAAEELRAQGYQLLQAASDRAVGSNDRAAAEPGRSDRGCERHPVDATGPGAGRRRPVADLDSPG